MNRTSEQDNPLMKRIIARDADALTDLYDLYGDAAYSLALRIVNNNATAEEITQDVFLKVWHTAEQWNPERGPLLPWLLGITRFTAIDRLRKENRRPDVTLTPIDDFEMILGNRALVDDPDWQDRRALKKLLTQLPHEQAQVIEMAFFRGYTHTDLAATLDLPLGTVKTRLRLGLQKLKSMWLLTVESNIGIRSSDSL